MLISAIINQGEGVGLDNILWIILPLLCCMMAMGQRGERASAPVTVTESWFTVQDIETTYKAVEAETAEWRKKAEERKKERGQSLTSRLRGALGGGKAGERYVVKETKQPRLFRMDDPTGPIYFELTEVEGGGTVVKTTYSTSIKIQMAGFKASLPLKIPAAPIGNRCPSCGKSVLPEFNICPYCGEKLIKE
jgi:hypothetical protein